MGFNNIGKPIPAERKDRAYNYCKEAGLDPSLSLECINNVSDKLERDLPASAQKQAMKYIDLTGSYRIIATLLTDDK